MQLAYRTFKKLVLVGAFCMTSISFAHILMRSQSVDSARELAGWAHKVNLFAADACDWYGTFAVTAEYAQSFNSKKIARCLFGDSLINSSCSNDFSCAQVNVSGSRVANRGNKDLLADYFGLPTDFQSAFSIKPTVRSFIVDFDFYFGLDRWMSGSWFRIHAPIVYTDWKLNLHESVLNEGVNPYVEGYFSPVAVARGNLNTSFSSYLAGAAPTLTGNGTFDPIFLPLEHMRVPEGTVTNGLNHVPGSCNGKGLHTTKLSDIQAVLGWNFWQNEDYHVGVGARISIPTGTQIKDFFLFQPIVGNGHHFEAGGMFTSHYTFWRSCDEDRSMGIYVDANITHLFDTKQCRSFDLCGHGDNSRYMLAMQLNSPYRDANGAFAGYALTGNPEGATPPAYIAPATGYTRAQAAFDGIFAPVANIAFGAVNVNIPVQADVTVMFNYKQCGFEFDLGYNLWATTCEQINFIDNCPIICPQTWALKGDAHVYGFDVSASPVVAGAVPLSATESEATIFSGTNYVAGNTIAQAQTNIGIDHPQFAYGDSTNINSTLIPGRALFATSANPQPAILAQTNTSIQPIFLSDCDLDIAGARARGLTNKIFTHISYTWEDCCLSPYFGIGGKAEFAQNNANKCGNGCNVVSNESICDQVNTCFAGCNDDCGASCARCNLSEWGIWLKGGISF